MARSTNASSAGSPRASRATPCQCPAAPRCNIVAVSGMAESLCNDVISPVSSGSAKITQPISVGANTGETISRKTPFDVAITASRRPTASLPGTDATAVRSSGMPCPVTPPAGSTKKVCGTSARAERLASADSIVGRSPLAIAERKPKSRASTEALSPSDCARSAQIRSYTLLLAFSSARTVSRAFFQITSWPTIATPSRHSANKIPYSTESRVLRR